MIQSNNLGILLLSSVYYGNFFRYSYDTADKRQKDFSCKHHNCRENVIKPVSSLFDKDTPVAQ